MEDARRDALAGGEDDVDPFEQHRRTSRVSDRETEYHKRRKMVISPDRVDPFADDSEAPSSSSRQSGACSTAAARTAFARATPCNAPIAT